MLLGVGVILRPWEERDLASLVSHANNRNVSRHLKDQFPHPYSRADGEAWIARCLSESGKPRHLAIDVDGQAVGGVGVELLGDVHRGTGEIGYWLAELFWGRGHATAAVKAMTPYAMATFDLHRLQAVVFEGNTASTRVLEKCGYELEGILRRSVVKDGRILDGLLYACVRESTVCRRPKEDATWR